MLIQNIELLLDFQASIGMILLSNSLPIQKIHHAIIIPPNLPLQFFAILLIPGRLYRISFQPLNNVQLENSYCMKYQCDNCQFCCISTSSSVSYCGLSAECNQHNLSDGILIGISILSIVLFALLLWALYYFFRNRPLHSDQYPKVNLQSEQIQPPTQEKNEIGKLEKVEKVKIHKEKSVTKTTVENKSRKSRLSKFTKYSIPSTTHADTQRGLR